jgi:hypothetical protein
MQESKEKKNSEPIEQVLLHSIKFLVCCAISMLYVTQLKPLECVAKLVYMPLVLETGGVEILDFIKYGKFLSPFYTICNTVLFG